VPQVSIREYARQRGCSHTAVQKAIKVGKLSAAITGTAKDTLIDVDTANAEWPKGEQENQREAQAASAPDKLPVGSSGNAELSKTSTTYAQSRAVREAYAARLAKLDFEKKSGKLVEAAAVEEKWTDIATTVRTRVLGISSKAKQRIPGLTVQQYKILDLIVVEALEALEGAAPEEAEPHDG
jgi:phage terminase Nu1 subunit (DNA packaging protein)